MSPYRQTLLSKTGRKHISTSPVETNDLKNMGYRLVDEASTPAETESESTVEPAKSSSPAPSSQVSAAERPFKSRKAADESKTASE